MELVKLVKYLRNLNSTTNLTRHIRKSLLHSSQERVILKAQLLFSISELFTEGADTSKLHS